MSENEYLQQRVFDLENEMELLKKEISTIKKLLPDNLTRKIGEIETKIGELQESIDDLENP